MAIHYAYELSYNPETQVFSRETDGRLSQESQHCSVQSPASNQLPETEDGCVDEEVVRSVLVMTESS